MQSVALERQVGVKKAINDAFKLARNPSRRSEFVVEGSSLDIGEGEQVPEICEVRLDVLQRRKYAGASFAPRHVLSDCSEYYPRVTICRDRITNTIVVTIATNLKHGVFDR